jgi:hypothetical protein
MYQVMSLFFIISEDQSMDYLNKYLKLIKILLLKNLNAWVAELFLMLC